MGWYLRFPDHEEGSELEPFVWDEQERGSLTPLNLIRAEGWMQPLEVSMVLEKWLAPERSGSVNGETWLVPEQDSAGIRLDEASRAERAQLYQELVQVAQAQLQDLQAYQFSCNSDYAVAVLVGQTVLAGQTGGQWLCLLPIVPHTTRVDSDSPIRIVPETQPPTAGAPMAETSRSTGSEAQVQSLLNRLGTIQLYGYYGGGYGQIHDYKLIAAVGPTIDQAIERAIRQAGLVQIDRFEDLQPTRDAGQWKTQFEQLNQLLQRTFPQRWLYRFSFWNYDHFYLIGQTDGYWGGVVLRSQYTYNP
jgi:hypothetical protein